MDCKVCSKPLGELEESLDRTYHYDCVTCEHCNKSITQDMFDRWNDGKVAYRAHQTCQDKYIQEIVKQRPITITQGELDWLNVLRTITEPNLSNSIEDNESNAELGIRMYNHTKSIEEKYLTLKKLQAACAMQSILLKNTQADLNVLINRERIDSQRKERDAKLIKDTAEGRVSEQRRVELKREKKSPQGKLIAQMMSSAGLTEEKARELLGLAKKEATESVQ